MRNYKSGSTTILEVVCAIIFVIFSIHYIFSFQGDILGMMQYSWSDHETHYNRFIGGGIIMTLLIILTYLINLFCSFPVRFKALVYMPAMLLMGQITAVVVDDAGNVTMPFYPAWVTILLLLGYPFIVKWCNKLHTPSVLPLDAEAAMQWLVNGIVLAVLMIMTYSIGNTDRNLHTRLILERLCYEGQYTEVLEEGIPQHDHCPAMTMWRAMALAHKEKQDSVKYTMLGEQLFTYNIDGDNKELLPHKGSEPHTLLYGNYPVWQTIGFVPRNINEDPVVYLKREIRRHSARPAAKDYLLCTYLLRKDLSDFIHDLPKYYSVKESLPQHYKEALVMYYDNPLHQSMVIKDSVLLDSAMIEDYHDFQDIMHSNHNNTIRHSKLRDSYFGTYWYYFYRKE